MPAPHLYHSAYPGAGSVALLCEGDLVGYESATLRRWLADQLGATPFVDLWPCGTAQAVFGVSDAIGRGRPIVVIEDRDFRTAEEASKDSQSLAEDRRRRGITILGWHAWSRNEIENYFLDLEVIGPVFAGAFGCGQDEVKEIVVALLPALSVFQAVPWALFRARRDWKKTEPDPHLRTEIRQLITPIWDDSAKRASPPSFQLALHRLAENLAGWRERSLKQNRAFAENYGSLLLKDLEATYQAWRSPTLADSYWRTEWSGKEILQWIRIAMVSKKGVFNSNSRLRVPVQWNALDRKKQAELDREMERVLSPPLIEAFFVHLKEPSPNELLSEWQSIAAACKAGSTPQMA